MPTSLPLARQQQWLWNLHQEYPQWNCVFTWRSQLAGPLDLDALRRAAQTVIQRHSTLRTHFVTHGAEIQQQIDDGAPVYLKVVDVEGVSDAERLSHVERLIEQISVRKMDVTEGPLLGLTVLRLSSQEHILVLSFHHLVMDCFSVDSFFDVLWTAYAEARSGHSHSADGIPLRYEDYTRWQMAQYESWSTKHGRFWRERLEGAAPVRWPYDPSVASIKQGTLGKMRGFFGKQLSDQIRNAAQSARTLSAVAMLAIHVAAIARWCGQIDFIVPYNVAGRQSEHQKVIGYFSHVLYLRMQLEREDTFAGLLKRVGNELFRALLHQDFGSMAVEHPALLAGTFTQWITWSAGEKPGWTETSQGDAGPLQAERFSAREFGEGLTAIPPGLVDVEMSFFDTREGIHACGVYRADHFLDSTMQRFMAELQVVAEQFVNNPSGRVLSEEERISLRA